MHVPSFGKKKLNNKKSKILKQNTENNSNYRQDLSKITNLNVKTNYNFLKRKFQGVIMN